MATCNALTLDRVCERPSIRSHGHLSNGSRGHRSLSTCKARTQIAGFTEFDGTVASEKKGVNPCSSA